MTVFVIDEDVREVLLQLVERAKANPISLDDLKARVEAHKKIGLTVDSHVGRELDQTWHDRMDVLSAFLPISNFKVVYSREEHPGGWMHHLSVSSPVVGRAPLPQAVQMIMDVVGMGSLDGPSIMTYPEVFGENHVAINVLEQL